VHEIYELGLSESTHDTMWNHPMIPATGDMGFVSHVTNDGLSAPLDYTGTGIYQYSKRVFRKRIYSIT